MRLLNERNIALALMAATIIVIGVSVVMLARFRGDSDRPSLSIDDGEEIVGFSYQIVGFGDLDGWRSDETAESIPVFVRTCDTFAGKLDDTPLDPSAAVLPGTPSGQTLAGTVGDWRPACDAARHMLTQIYADPNARTSAARAFYEYYFRPVKLLNVWRRDTPKGEEEFARSDGLITAYFEPHYQASDVWTSEFSAPVYFRPDDLISVDLGKFRPELAGQRVAGRVAGNALEPYPDHAEINDGALAGRARVL
ncbi:MAG: MltA domain-containing protein, partial [Parvularculaceae bacterium]|nr:MltA domain-containing protein [Parvularculaceae bacterium]